MDIITRAEWGAQHGDGRWPATVPAPLVVLHHSVTVAPDMEMPRDDDYEAIRTIERISAQRFGTVYGFPYTWGVTPAGLVFEGHHPGKTGAHTAGHNRRARAIVWVGNYEEMHPTQAQIEATAWLLRQAHDDGWIQAPQLTGGHRDYVATLCPGRHAVDDIATVNALAASGGPGEPKPEGWLEELLMSVNYVVQYVKKKGGDGKVYKADLLAGTRRWITDQGAWANDMNVLDRAGIPYLPPEGEYGAWVAEDVDHLSAFGREVS